MKDKILPFSLDAALVIVFFAAASFVLGTLYNLGFLSVFGLRSLVTSWDSYGTMFITWRLSVGWAIVVIAGYVGKAAVEYKIGRPLTMNESARTILGLLEITLILTVFYFFADRSYRRGILDAQNTISHPTEVTVVTNAGLQLAQPLYFATYGAEKYVLFSLPGPGRASLTTYVLHQSELRAMVIKSLGVNLGQK
jgi:hypothetical protein